MIKAIGTQGSLRTEFTNGKITSFSDTTHDKGGKGEGFRPHELLEAALANCMNMALRMLARKRAIELSSVETTVSLNRSLPDEVCFEGHLWDALNILTFEDIWPAQGRRLPI